MYLRTLLAGTMLVTGSSIIAAEPQTPTALIPRSVLFGNEDPTEHSLAQISPDGKRIAYIAPANKVLNIFVRGINDGEEETQQVTHEEDQNIMHFQWTYDDRIIYLHGHNGDENDHAYLVDIKSEKIRDLSPFPGVKVVDVICNKKFPSHIMLAMNKENPAFFEFYELNLDEPEKMVRRTTNPGNVENWLMTDNWQILGKEIFTADGEQQVWIRLAEDKPFEKIISWNFEDQKTSRVIDFCENDTALYIIDSRNTNTGQLKKINLLKKTEELISSDEQYEIGSVFIHPDTKKIISYSTIKDHSKPIFFDNDFKQDYDHIATKEGGDLNIRSMTKDLSMWICSFHYDHKAFNYYLYNRNTKKLTYLFPRTEKFAPYTLAHMEPISFTARDGLTIHGYLSLPLGQKENLPLVLNVHGGPWVHDTWGLNSEAQWLCNRGYAVLQVNYRGSTGYGKAFVNAGNKEWGHKMHYDLIDAVEWAIDKKIANPSKVAIYGGSYGGYAALAGVAFTPDVFCCAVDIVGPSNLLSFMKTIPPYWKPFIQDIYQRVGNSETEQEFLKERSPLFSAQNIKKPLLIAQGANDPRVNKAESDQIVEALKKNNCEYEYLVFEDEGHGFAKHENRMKFYAAAEKFLAKHLDGRCEE